MERTYKKFEIVGIPEADFGEATQNAVAKACQSLLHLDWIKMAVQSMTLSRLLANQRGSFNGSSL